MYGVDSIHIGSSLDVEHFPSQDLIQNAEPIFVLWIGDEFESLVRICTNQCTTILTTYSRITAENLPVTRRDPSKELDEMEKQDADNRHEHGRPIRT